GPGGRRAIRAGSASSTPNHAKMRPRHEAGAFVGQLTIGSAASNAAKVDVISGGASCTSASQTDRCPASPRPSRTQKTMPVPREVADQERDRKSGGDRLGGGGTNRRGDEIHADGLPAVGRHVDSGGPGAAAEVERPTGRQATSTLDDLDQLRWRDAAVPRRQP